MDILFITKERLSYNEAPPSRILNITSLLSKDHTVRIISRKSDAEIDRTYVREIPITREDFISNQVYKIVLFSKAISHAIRHRTDFIFTREYWHVLLLYPVSKILKFRTVYDMHCYRYKELLVEKKPLKSFTIRWAEKLSHRLADHITAVSPGLIEDLPPDLQKKAILLPNGVDLTEHSKKRADPDVLKRYGIGTRSTYVGFIGNWMEWVDIESFLESSRHVGPNVKHILIGQGYNDDLDRIRKKYPDVIVTGRIPHEDTVELLKRIDVCVLPYKKAEVLKHLSVRKTLEYLAAGKPIVMSDSPIGERSFLKDGENCMTYIPEDAEDLAHKIMMLIENRELMRRMSEKNRELSLEFSWKSVVESSHLSGIFHRFMPQAKKPLCRVAIVIKALNEQDNIERCIRSAMKALEGIDGEIILVDSKSSDRTVEIAMRFPIRILQLKDARDRCCGVGPQIGYLNSSSDFIYILDGDMTIDKDFIRKALPHFTDESIAGVAGNIHEKNLNNLVFQLRRKHNIVDSVKYVSQLGMGGLYSRKAIDDVGYFSNPYFYAYEEYDLGAKLHKLGYRLIKLPESMIEHYGDDTSPMKTVIGRFRSKYIFGSGQYLRRAMIDGHLIRTASELYIYILTILWFIAGIVSFIMYLAKDSLPIIAYALASAILLTANLAIKRNINKAIFSIFSWGAQSAGLMIGFVMGAGDPRKSRPEIIVVK